MRIAPLVVIVLIVATISSTLGAAFVWIIAGISIAALGVLFFFMVKQGQFVGPKILIDDAKERLSGSENEETDEAVVVVVHKDRTDG